MGWDDTPPSPAELKGADVPRGTETPGLLSRVGSAIKDQWDPSALKALYDEAANRKYPPGREPIENFGDTGAMPLAVMGPRGMMMAEKAVMGAGGVPSLIEAPASVGTFSNLPSAMQSSLGTMRAGVDAAGSAGGAAVDAAKTGAGLLGRAAKAAIPVGVGGAIWKAGSALKGLLGGGH